MFTTATASQSARPLAYAAALFETILKGFIAFGVYAITLPAISASVFDDVSRAVAKMRKGDGALMVAFYTFLFGGVCFCVVIPTFATAIKCQCTLPAYAAAIVDAFVMGLIMFFVYGTTIPAIGSIVLDVFSQVVAKMTKTE